MMRRVRVYNSVRVTAPAGIADAVFEPLSIQLLSSKVDVENCLL